MATSGRDWRAKSAKIRQEGIEVPLPSGMVARVRNVPIAMFLLEGGIPDSLTPLVAEVISGKEMKEGSIPPQKLLQANTEMLRAITRLSFVSPKIVASPVSDDEISIDDVDEEDMQTLMGLLGLPARRLHDFRQKQEGIVERIRAIEGDKQSPIGSSELISAVERFNGDS